MKWNWSRSLILKKRKLSYDNETSAGTVEQFEKICIDVRWGLWAHRTYVRLSGLWHSIHRSIFFWQYKRENALRRATARFTSKIEELQE
jgi:ATP/ADP translocase